MTADRGPQEPSRALQRSPLALGLMISALGVAGLCSLLAVPVERIVPLPLPALAIRALSLIQPAMLTVVAIPVGLCLAPKVGLKAPFLSGELPLDPHSLLVRERLGPALVIAISAAGVLYGFERAMAGLTAGLDAPARATLAAFQPPLVTRALYGGLTEEIISRWGLMTLFVWLISRLARQASAIPEWTYWIGAALAALLFSLRHLPLLFTMFGAPPVTVAVTGVALNTLVGFAFGWLFARFGLEAAMLSHALAHVIAAALFGLAG